MDVDRYARSEIQLRSLKSRLPKASVESVAREVIRRLAERQVANAALAPSNDEIECLCQALISDDDEAGARYVQGIRTAGASVETVYLEYLASAARMLGEWWERNLVSFVQVTIGTSRMYAIMRSLSDRHAAAISGSEKRAIFASVPGEAHTLGIRMVADLFREDGWEIDLMMGETHECLLAKIERSTRRNIGLSAAGQHSLKALSRLVVAIRIKRPDTTLVVSGQVLDEHQETISLMDIDGMTNDLGEAKRLFTGFSGQTPALA